ncbi:MAG: DivIVA domain-containing protein [Faecalibacterium sp.]|nr:DivIVA domain-containing protein [Faecalibacterium sp.]
MVTAHDVNTITFDKAMRGYSVEQVDQFLEKAAAQLEQDEARISELTKNNEALRAKAAELDKKLEGYVSYEDALKAALLNAQRMGENVIREAKQKADALVREASIRADDITRAAESKTDEQKIELERIKSEVAQFKSNVLSLYKAHIESLSTLPDTAPEEAEQPAQKAEAPEPQQPAAEPEMPAEEIVPAAPAAEPEVEEPAKDVGFWEQDEKDLAPQQAPEQQAPAEEENVFGQSLQESIPEEEKPEAKPDSFRGISFSD